jgi:hypothetical protein
MGEPLIGRLQAKADLTFTLENGSLTHRPDGSYATPATGQDVVHRHGSQLAQAGAADVGARKGAEVHRGVLRRAAPHREGPMMGTLIDSKPSDPMYREGPQSYSPHWARPFAKPAAPKPPKDEASKDDAPPQQ